MQVEAALAFRFGLLDEEGVLVGKVVLTNPCYCQETFTFGWSVLMVKRLSAISLSTIA
jgi:hypothetical protein